MRATLDRTKSAEGRGICRPLPALALQTLHLLVGALDIVPGAGGRDGVLLAHAQLLQPHVAPREARQVAVVALDEQREYLKLQRVLSRLAGLPIKDQATIAACDRHVHLPPQEGCLVPEAATLAAERHGQLDLDVRVVGLHGERQGLPRWRDLPLTLKPLFEQLMGCSSLP